MSLKEYLKNLGDVAAAKRFGITERAARSYREGQRKPKPAVANKMVKRSKGELTLSAIYADD